MTFLKSIATRRNLIGLVSLMLSFALGWGSHSVLRSSASNTEDRGLGIRLSSAIKADLLGLKQCPSEIQEQQILIGCRRIPLAPSSNISGNVDEVSMRGQHLFVSGWAADLRNFSPASLVLLTLDGELKFWMQPTTSRPDVADHFKKPELSSAGYNFSIPTPDGFRLADHRLRIFAISNDGEFKEMTYTASK